MTLTWQLVDDRGAVLAAVEDVGDMAVEDRSHDVLVWYGQFQAAVRQALGWRPACLNCGQLNSACRRGRCTACYDYRRRHGAERPSHVITRHLARPCRMCGGPARPSHRARGYCWNCYVKHYRLAPLLARETA